MKHLITLLGVFSLFTFAAAAQQSTESMWVNSTSGSANSFALDDVGKITFTSSQLQVNLNSGSLSAFNFDEVASITFFNLQGNDIRQPAVSDNSVNIFYDASSSLLRIASQNMIKGVKIYSLQGSLVKNVLTHSQSVEPSLSALPAGVYVVSVNTDKNVSVKKFVKQ